MNDKKIVDDYIDELLKNQKELLTNNYNAKREEYYNKLQSNWNSLREWLKYEYLLFDNESDEYRIASEILDKMNELEGKSDDN